MQLHKKPRKGTYSVGIARRLRREMTLPERFLWIHLRNKGLDGLKFRRQVPYGRYIIDFLCDEASLAVEVDGKTHEESQEYDVHRDAFLAAGGIRTLRISARDVLSDLEHALEVIRVNARARTNPSAPLP